MTHHVDGGERLRIVHPGRPEETDRADLLTVDEDRRHDDRARRQRLDTVLDADRHRHPPLHDVADQGHHDELLLEGVEHLADDVDGVERGGYGRGAAHVDVVVGAHGANRGSASAAQTGRRPGRRSALGRAPADSERSGERRSR